MADFSREHYVKLVEHDYFGSVAGEDVAAALRCFTPEARVTIYHGDAPARLFAVIAALRSADVNPEGSGAPIAAVYYSASEGVKYTSATAYILTRAGNSAGKGVKTRDWVVRMPNVREEYD